MAQSCLVFVRMESEAASFLLRTSPELYFHDYFYTRKILTALHCHTKEKSPSYISSTNPPVTLLPSVPQVYGTKPGGLTFQQTQATCISAPHSRKADAFLSVPPQPSKYF